MDEFIKKFLDKMKEAHELQMKAIKLEQNQNPFSKLENDTTILIVCNN
jgi:hypothetical protein